MLTLLSCKSWRSSSTVAWQSQSIFSKHFLTSWHSDSSEVILPHCPSKQKSALFLAFDILFPFCSSLKKVLNTHAQSVLESCVCRHFQLCLCCRGDKEIFVNTPGVDTIFFDQKNVYNVVSYFTTVSNVF